MFEAGDIEGISANDLKHFIKKRTNEKLVELGELNGLTFVEDVTMPANNQILVWKK